MKQSHFCPSRCLFKCYIYIYTHCNYKSLSFQLRAVSQTLSARYLEFSMTTLELCCRIWLGWVGTLHNLKKNYILGFVLKVFVKNAVLHHIFKSVRGVWKCRQVRFERLCDKPRKIWIFWHANTKCTFQVEEFYLLTDSTHYPHQLNMANTVEDSNEKHLEPWSAACERDGIHTTPLSPYLDQVSQVALHG